MTDPFSAASGAIGVISLGITVCQGLIDYYNAWNGQDEEIKQTLESIAALSKTLVLLRNALGNRQLDRVSKTQLEENIKLCEAGIRALKKKLTKIQYDDTSLSGSTKTSKVPGSVRRFYDRAKYPFKQSTIVKLREIVSETRANLQLAAAVLHLYIKLSF